MNCYGAKDLAESFRTVRKNTLVIANEIGEDQYGFRATPESRTIAQTLFHIASSSNLQEHLHGKLKVTTLEGFDFPGFFIHMVAAEQESRTKAQIVQALTESRDRFGSELVAILELGPQPLSLASVRSFTPGLLIDVYLFVAEPREVAIHCVALVYPFAQGRFV